MCGGGLMVSRTRGSWCKLAANPLEAAAALKARAAAAARSGGRPAGRRRRLAHPAHRGWGLITKAPPSAATARPSSRGQTARVSSHSPPAAASLMLWHRRPPPHKAPPASAQRHRTALACARTGSNPCGDHPQIAPRSPHWQSAPAAVAAGCGCPHCWFRHAAAQQQRAAARRGRQAENCCCCCLSRARPSRAHRRRLGLSSLARRQEGWNCYLPPLSPPS
jgi:hypothetical protein